MTQIELDQLIQEIGEEVQRRLGREPVAVDKHGCACGTMVEPRPRTNGRGAPDSTFSRQSVASFISQALLQPGAAAAEIQRSCAEARPYGFASVCVNPARVALAARELRGTKTKVAAVIGSPHGATLTSVKLAEAEQVIKLGAHELEMVIHAGALNSGDLDAVYTEIRLAADFAHAARVTLKVLADMAALGEEQKAALYALARLAGADGVKTCNDAAGDVALAHRIVGGELMIEAAGEIDSYARFREMIAAGATRIGTSEGARIVTEAAGG